MLGIALFVGAGALMLWQATQNAADPRRATMDYDGDGISDFALLRWPNTPPPGVATLSWYIYKSGGVAHTPTGSNVTVQANNATVTFPAVSGTGDTTFTPIDPPSSAGTPPSGYTIVGSGPAVNITTTASYTPPVVVCLIVSSVNDQATFDRVRVLHGESGVLVDRTILSPDTPAPNFATRTVCARSNTLSPFVAALAPPTAAGVEITGRVMTAEGRGVRNARVSITDEQGVSRTTITGARGNYSFNDIEPGHTYIVRVSSRRVNFAPQVVQINDNIADLNFVAE